MTQSRVVVGVDGSPLSMAAVTRAAQVASARGFSLHVLHAFAPDLPMLGFGELSEAAGRVLIRWRGHNKELRSSRRFDSSRRRRAR